VARTPQGAQLTEAHRQLQTQVNAATLRDLLHLWGVVDPRNLRHTVDPFTRAAASVVLRGRGASSVASARYYAAFRQVEGVKGPHVVPNIAPPLKDELVTGLVRGAALSGIMNAYGRGQNPDQAKANGFVKLAGSASSLVYGGGRATILDAVRSDPAAHGYQRVTDGSACAFCAMIASRGIVAYSEDSAGFEAHDHCGCGAEPAFEGSQVLPTNARLREAWDTATAGLGGTDALNAFRTHLAGQ
jgi:hypothetical protein